LKRDAIEVILEGADEGEVDRTPRPSSKISFSRSLPLGKAYDDVLLAHEMNGEKLTATHGFPLRAIVPGWYAMASVKWLRRLIVTSKPFNGYYQSLDYSFWDRSGALPTLAPRREQQVKAEIARPQNGGHSRQHNRQDSWRRVGCDADITKVEVSVDSGATWHEARLPESSVKNAWRLWEYDWHTGRAETRLLARATDSCGRVSLRARRRSWHLHDQSCSAHRVEVV
jgi:DMSO/TMAO reductase YedYZ molybdopterin-dependent catalytic subunit